MYYVGIVLKLGERKHNYDHHFSFLCLLVDILRELSESSIDQELSTLYYFSLLFVL